MEELCAVGELDCRFPHHVVLAEIGDLPSETLEFLQRNDIGSNTVRQAPAARGKN